MLPWIIDMAKISKAEDELIPKIIKKAESIERESFNKSLDSRINN